MSDLRYALRQLRAAPGFALTAISILGLGIGANVAMFSVVNAYLLAPLPYPNPQQLARVWEITDRGGRANSGGGVAIDLMDHATLFEVASFFPLELNLEEGDRPELLSGGEVTASYLRVLGIPPLLGRGFTAEEDAPGSAARVVVLTHELWRSHFGADPTLVGRTIRLDRENRTVVGILPPRALPSNTAAFLVPASLRGHDHKRNRLPWYSCTIYARVQEGATIAQAEDELRAIRQRLAASYAVERAAWTMQLEPLQDAITRAVRPTLLSLFAAVGVVLLVACVNVANLLLARSATRQKEIAIRTALGANWWRIVRQLLLEAGVLAAGGGVLGVVIASLGIDTMVRLTADALPRAIPVTLDGRALALAALLVGGTAVVFGTLPALGTTFRTISRRLAAGARGASASRRRTQSMLIVAQMALTVVLLIGTALLLRSFANAMNVDPGYNPDNTLAFDVVRPGVTVPDAAHRIEFAHRAVAQLTSLPGIVAASASTSLPLTQSARHADYVSVEERPDTRHDLVANFDGVAGDYFGAMGILLLRGRVFTETDDRVEAAPVVMLDDTLARSLFGDEDPIGRRVHFQDKAREVVGVVATTHHRRLDGDSSYHVYVPFTAFPWRSSSARRCRRSNCGARSPQPSLSSIRNNRSETCKASAG